MAGVPFVPLQIEEIEELFLGFLSRFPTAIGFGIDFLELMSVRAGVHHVMMRLSSRADPFETDEAAAIVDEVGRAYAFAG